MFKKIISILNYFVLFFNKSIYFKNSSVFLARIKCDSNNRVKLYHSNLYHSKLSVIEGFNNIIKLNGVEVIDSFITIKGSNNKINIENGVKLRKSTITIRGQNSSVTIGSGTTFGEVRIINVGQNNPINIGNNCLFADNIEIWASDTHSIYDKDGYFINPELPINIGNNVWIGSHVKILKGVTIGDGAIVGMNALVTKNIEPKTLNVGNPSKCIKNDITWSLKYENE